MQEPDIIFSAVAFAGVIGEGMIVVAFYSKNVSIRYWQFAGSVLTKCKRL
jgi:hypothetical protein